MNTFDGIDRDVSPSLAPRTCAQCNKSKKKCDKLIPKCSRCLRLAMACTYPDLERPNDSENGNDAVKAQFDEVFERLQRIEAHVFRPSSTRQGNDVDSEHQGSLINLAQSYGIKNPNPVNWALEPGTLKPQFLSLMLWQSLLATLDEHKVTVKDVISVYISQTDKWLPMLSSVKLQEELKLYSRIHSSDKFVLLLLSIHLLVSPPADHPPSASLAESTWYRKCKYMFAQFVAFREPNVELIQAGMLISLFEFHSCIDDRAFTTLGICSRLAYLLNFDEVMAKHSTQDLGKLNDEDEEIILTWMGLTRLERYFSMPPAIIPKVQFMPLHFDADPSCRCASPYSGPEIAKFSTLDLDALANCIFEYDAAQRNGRIQKFIRDNRYAVASPQLREKIDVMLQDLEEYLAVRRVQMDKDGAWAGIPVVLGAAIQIQCFFVAKNTCTMDDQIMRSLYSYIEQLRDIISRCRVFNGFQENYLDGVQPTWCSLPYQALKAYRLVQDADEQRSLPAIDVTIFIEVLQMMAPRCLLATKCLELLELPQTMENMSPNYFGASN